jgi:S1-C subfamily serine protease
VTEVQEDTPAERASLRAEDLILSINGQRVESVFEPQCLMQPS